MTGRRTTVASGLALLALTGCGGVSGAVVADDGVEILAPAPMDVMRTPFDVAWEGDAGPGGSFAVFIDRRPIAPGQSLDEAFEDACDGADGCPDDAFLSARGVHVTDETALTIALLPPRGGIDGVGDLDVHRATIVLVDGDGVRRGEQAWSTEFRVQR